MLINKNNIVKIFNTIDTSAYMSLKSLQIKYIIMLHFNVNYFKVKLNFKLFICYVNICGFCLLLFFKKNLNLN